jgi:hypothetical protein
MYTWSALSVALQVGAGGFAPLAACSPAADADTIARALPVDHLRSMLSDGSMSMRAAVADSGGSGGMCHLKVKTLVVFVREVSGAAARTRLAPLPHVFAAAGGRASQYISHNVPPSTIPSNPKYSATCRLTPEILGANGSTCG